MTGSLRWPALLALALLACASGCGRDAQDAAFDPFAKGSAPTLPRTFHGHPLAHWLEAVGDGDPSRRAEAAWALGELGLDASANAAAFDTLLADPDPRVRQAALHALLQLGSVPTPVAWRVLALAERGDPVAIDLRDGGFVVEPELLPMLESEDAFVRLAALEWMTGAEGDFRSIAPRVRALASDANDAVAKAATALLGAVDPEGAAALAADTVSLLLDAEARDDAIARLSLLGAAARPALQSFVESDEAAANPMALQVAKMLLLRSARKD